MAGVLSISGGVLWDSPARYPHDLCSPPVEQLGPERPSLVAISFALVPTVVSPPSVVVLAAAAVAAGDAVSDLVELPSIQPYAAAPRGKINLWYEEP
jgi:hypothetical protein